MTQSKGALALIESPFTFEDHPVRVTMRDGEPWFVASDVCKALKIVNTSDALRNLDNDEKMTLGLTEGHSGRRGGAQFQAIISEPGLHTLILRCRDAVKPGTLPHRFRRWVTHDVLPSIRKTGHYGDPARLIKAQALAAEVAAVASRTVFQAIVNGQDRLEFARWVFSLRHTTLDGGVQVPWCEAIDGDAHIASMTQLAEMLLMPGSMGATDAELARLAAACIQVLARRIEHRAAQQ